MRAFFMRRPVQRKHATEVAHGPRGEQRKINLPYSIADHRICSVNL